MELRKMMQSHSLVTEPSVVMKILLVFITIFSIITLSYTMGPLIIKEGDSSAIIMGQSGDGDDVPIVIDEKKTFKSMIKSLFMG